MEVVAPEKEHTDTPRTFCLQKKKQQPKTNKQRKNREKIFNFTRN